MLQTGMFTFVLKQFLPAEVTCTNISLIMWKKGLIVGGGLEWIGEIGDKRTAVVSMGESDH